MKFEIRNKPEIRICFVFRASDFYLTFNVITTTLPTDYVQQTHEPPARTHAHESLSSKEQIAQTPQQRKSTAAQNRVVKISAVVVASGVINYFKDARIFFLSVKSIIADFVALSGDKIRARSSSSIRPFCRST